MPPIAASRQDLTPVNGRLNQAPDHANEDPGSGRRGTNCSHRRRGAATRQSPQGSRFASRARRRILVERTSVNDETKKNVAAATYPGDPAATPTRTRMPTGRALRLADAVAFVRGFWERPFEVASVFPSTVFLEAGVVQAAELERARCVVDLGSGTGGTTRAILRALTPQARLLAIDVNPDFCSRMRRLIDDPRLAVHTGSAESLADALRRQGLPAADVVISGIPFSTLPHDTARRVAAAIHANLAPGGRVVAYQCRSHVARYLEPHLGPPRATWVWRSLPPMRVFVWVNQTVSGATPGPAEAGAATASAIQDRRRPLA